MFLLIAMAAFTAMVAMIKYERFACRCSALQLQWYENGVAMPGATSTTYTVSRTDAQAVKEVTVYCGVSKIDGSCAPGKTTT